MLLKNMAVSSDKNIFVKCKKIEVKNYVTLKTTIIPIIIGTLRTIKRVRESDINKISGSLYLQEITHLPKRVLVM